jgi:hypothetical protein
MATSVSARPWWLGTAAATAVADAAFALGAIALTGEAAVHIQQYASLVHGVRWIGPLFLANAAACIAAILALAYRPIRPLAALVGTVTSALALAGLIVSYGREGGLLGWPEAGFRTAIVLAVVSELAAVVLLSTGLAALTASQRDVGLPTPRTDRDDHARDDNGLRHPFPWFGTRGRTTA